MKQQNLNTRTLSFEHTKDTKLLANFSCGIESIDDFIHNELQDYVNMGGCEMVIVREDDQIVAMYCTDSLNLHISEAAKEKMMVGAKPIPKNVPAPDDFYWLKPFYDAVEITYLAVNVNKQHSHIGSFIIEHIINEIANSQVECDFVAVRALKCQDYTAVPFYGKCGFYAAEEEEPNRNLFMYRVIMR